jgi:hypothetical protein|tara:strand:+ start:961 stop:1092 length:132 start_codon:yes stop_codon:yes gene_type:complete
MEVGGDVGIRNYGFRIVYFRIVKYELMEDALGIIKAVMRYFKD